MKSQIPFVRLILVGLIVAYLSLQMFLLSYMFSSESEAKLNHAPPVDSIAAPSIDLQEEIQKGLAYAKSIPDTKRKLIFVHIPKTAGTTIEEVAGLQAKLPWGSCLFNHRPKRRGGVCKYPPGQFEWPMKIGYWHLPTQLFPIKGVNPYEGADLFAVARDPYDRLLSEFYYLCRKKVTKWWNAVECNMSRVHEPEYLNEWLQQKIGAVPSRQWTPKDFLRYNGHFTPQFDFLVSRPAGVRVVDYLLRMDNLTDQFHSLMDAYEIKARMLPHKKNAARNDTIDLTAEHFTAETVSLIQAKYGFDIDLMGSQHVHDVEQW